MAQLLMKEIYEKKTKLEIGDVVRSIPEYYPTINPSKLQTELEVYYDKPEIYHKDLLKLYKYLKTSTVAEDLSEITKLVEILITIPMTTTEPERKFSTMKRIKRHMRSTMSNPRLNALAILSMEKKLFRHGKVGLMALVVNNFVKKVWIKV